MGLAALANTDTAKGCAGHPALGRVQAPAQRPSGEALEETAASDELTDLVGEDGERDLVAIGLALEQ